MVPSSAALRAARFVPALSRASGYSLLPTRLAWPASAGRRSGRQPSLPAAGDDVSSAPPLAP